MTDLTERGDGPQAEIAAGAALIPVPPAGLVTVAATPAAPAPLEPVISRVPVGQTGANPAPERTFPVISGRRGVSSRTDGPGAQGAEPAQPVFTRYWLHGKGPAPAGNLPVAVHLSPGHITLNDPRPDVGPGPGRLRLSVACGPGGGAGEVTLDVPPGLAVTGPDGGPVMPLRYTLGAGGCARWELMVAALPGAIGRYFVSARIPGDLGQVLEDTSLVTVGEPPPPSRSMPRAERDALLVADLQAREAEIETALEPAVLEVAPGACTTLTVRLANRTAGVIRGESQLLSPFGTWHQARPWTRGFTADPGEAISLDYTVTVPAGTRPGSEWWALAKVMYFGRARYTESAQIRVAG